MGKNNLNSRSEFEVNGFIHHFLNNFIFKHKKFKIDDTILIAGAPRSGTTWLMEILGYTPQYISLFEPLNPKWYPESRKIGFQNRIYFPPESKWSEGEQYLSRILSGYYVRVENLYMSSYERFIHSLFANKLLVKSIRICRLLPWIYEHFNLRKIFFIIRHPCAVVASQLKTGYCGYHENQHPYNPIFPKIKNVINEISDFKHLDPALISKLKNIETQEEILAAIWCFDNYYPLFHSNSPPWKIIKYEKMVMNGLTKLQNIYNEIGQTKLPKKAIQHLRIPSQLTPGILAPGNEIDIVTKSEKQLSKWKNSLSDDQINKIMEIVEAFGFDIYKQNNYL